MVPPERDAGVEYGGNKENRLTALLPTLLGLPCQQDVKAVSTSYARKLASDFLLRATRYGATGCHRTPSSHQQMSAQRRGKPGTFRNTLWPGYSSFGFRISLGLWVFRHLWRAFIPSSSSQTRLTQRHSQLSSFGLSILIFRAIHGLAAEATKKVSHKQPLRPEPL
jgi:hypothetical protein